MTDEFQKRIEAEDLRLFDRIASQTSDDDKRSLLCLQRYTRNRRPRYAYLEIGSHLGGSIQPHLIDGRCIKIYSIDPRPTSQADERGGKWKYEDNSTDRMLENLRQVANGAIAKISCFDSDARDVETGAIAQAPDLCFIDGQHSNDAVVSDFQFCKVVCDSDAVIAFHDDWVVLDALRSIVSTLAASKIDFTARKLAGSVFAIGLGETSTHSEFKVLGENGLQWLRIQAAERFVESGFPRSVRRAARKALRLLSQLPVRGTD